MSHLRRTRIRSAPRFSSIQAIYHGIPLRWLVESWPAFCEVVCEHYIDCHVEEQMKSILDPSFKYTPSISTDVRKTFAKVLREERLKAKQKEEHKPVVASIFSHKSR